MPNRRNAARLLIICDDEDRLLVDGSAWCLSNGYPSRRRNGQLEYLHALIAGAKHGHEVDHRNGNKLDVRRNNLCHKTHHANTQNLKLSKKNTSGFRGVSRRGNKWRAYATIHGRQHSLGTFSTLILAHEAARTFRRINMKGSET